LILLLSPIMAFTQSFDIFEVGPESGATNGNPIIDFYLTEIRDCNDKYDGYIEFYPAVGYDKNTKTPIVIDKIEVTPMSNPSKSKFLHANSGFRGEFYDLDITSMNTLDFQIKSYDDMGSLINQSMISKSVISEGSIEVSESLFSQIYDMGHSRKGTGLGDVTNPDVPDLVITYFCGKVISKVNLLSFLQKFLDLTPAQICEIKALFELAQLEYRSDEVVEWTNEYCELLEEFWDLYGGGSGGGNDGPCECKVINSRVFVDHSVGNATGTALENCPDVSKQDGYKLYSHDSGNINYTNGDRNWGLYAWSKMGAAKAMYSISHHYTGHDDDTGDFRMEKTLNNSDLKSGVQFSMKCHEGGTVSTKCECSKEVLTKVQYVSRVSGRAGTDGNGVSSGNGEVNGCMEDFAFLTMFSRDGGQVIKGNGALTCVDCKSTDSTSFLTDLGTLASGIEEIVPTVIDTGGFDISKIDDYFNGANSVAELFEDILINPPCDQPKDTTYNLIDTFHTYTLTPSKDFVSYVLSSRLWGRTDFANDEAYHQLKLISDYYIASGLESTGDSTCCDEKVGGYTIGHLGDFDYSFTAMISGDKVQFDGHEFKINDPYKSTGIVIENSDLFAASPNSLQRLQRDVAQLFTLIHPDFLKDVFGLDCGPGCTVDVNCYYNCGYFGDCHEEDDGFTDVNGNSNGLHINNNDIELLNSKSDEEVSAVNSNKGNDTDNLEGMFKAFIPTESVKIYPNPINDSNDLIVEFPANHYKSLHIISPSGVILQSIDVGLNQGETLVKGSILQTGLNYIVLRSIDGSVFVDKVIKN